VLTKMVEQVSRLYECRGCGTLVRVTTGGCPNCGKTDGGTKKIRNFEGEVVERDKAWYRVIELVSE